MKPNKIKISYQKSRLDKSTFMQEFLARNMKNVKIKLCGQFLKRLADIEDKGEKSFLKHSKKPH